MSLERIYQRALNLFQSRRGDNIFNRALTNLAEKGDSTSQQKPEAELKKPKKPKKMYFKGTNHTIGN